MIIKLTEKQEDELRVKVFKALSDPIRLEIIRYLKKVNRGVTCGEIGEIVKMSKSAGSYHFKILREAGLILTRKQSREKYVSLNYDIFDKYVTKFLDSL
ncbi:MULTISPECIES: ArsR/SmtB family transcription factor [Sporolactobacillus]|uniref:Transcriptional regulator n=4 Tax=Sporolactobacillus TaxID=2077 RepID=A0A917S783_9BACL|nr:MULTISPECIES: metalloregulator ArsR/SmtB family transcription factor [Sporolactobacillus]RYL92287.1 ArsR family transcriptional regulator [Sporolactobacillus sp. THM7-4]KLI01902.1 transcriptional regulator [Sporolactobacillus inulinus CASD]SFG59467.1 DNA-binding transcriptional regulator, ArsR family [Sporolactobacillus nakayamae]GAY76815.1 transcriptional regulator, ArsR family [Sporolactobacillus inulinus]GEB76761.1 transcriptional regulator [Sporolactobacillus inulinus]